MRRSGAPVLLVMGGLGLWFGPWRATSDGEQAASVEVVCAAAPVDLMLYGVEPVEPSSRACHTSSWWRTIAGTAMLGVGIGSATRDRTAARIARGTRMGTARA